MVLGGREKGQKRNNLGLRGKAESADVMHTQERRGEGLKK